jgi:hypothetical protein
MAHACCPGKSLKLPPGHCCRTPATQYSPGAHNATPVRVCGAAAPSGVEYQPTGTTTGARDAGGQYTEAFPHATAVALTEPAGQKKPASQLPLQVEFGSDATAPKRPAMRAKCGWKAGPGAHDFVLCTNDTRKKAITSARSEGTTISRRIGK